MDLREEHQRHRDFWNRRILQRARTASQFRYQCDFYERYKEQLREPFLDVGCGDGELLEFLIKDGRERVYGIDISDVATELARERLRPYMGTEASERIRTGDMVSLSQYYSAGFFNTLFCEGTLHQTTYSGARLTATEISKVVSGGGLAYVSVRSNSTPPRNAEMVEGERETYRLGDEDGIVRCYFSKQGLVDLFEDAFEILELEEKELITRIGTERYKMWIMVMRRRGGSR